MRVIESKGGFEVATSSGLTLLRHTQDNPCLGIGKGEGDFAMRLGNFTIDKGPFTPITLINHELIRLKDGACRVDFWGADPAEILLSIALSDAAIDVVSNVPDANRFWIKLVALEGEAVWGCGEQYSYLNLRGRLFPLWASEPGVGRDKSTALTQKMDEEGGAGGDYWTTGYPQPTFISSRGYAVHADSSAYAEFDFEDTASHTLSFWNIPQKFEIFTGENIASLVAQLGQHFGPQRALPDWALEGASVGLKDGVESFDRLENMLSAGAAITGLWCEDWVGLRETSFGSRLFWDWQANERRYPGLKARIASLRERGVRFLGYINPYLCVDGELFVEAQDGDHLVRRSDSGDIYIEDFGEFDCGMVDLTRPATREWFAHRIIGKEMIDLGMSGWMADFGEYLPTDVALHDGSDPKEAHNRWPVLWAQVNDEALRHKGVSDDIVFFMRSGGAGLARHCPLLWAGDQSVDFSRHDGIGTALTAALSAGLVGNGHSHSDIGGYTSLHGNVRSRELLMRWAEMAVFTPFMRTHEGNRPKDNVQVDTDIETLDHFAAMTRLHANLAPYSKAVSQEVANDNLPMQRPMFLHYDREQETHNIQDQYLYGRDLLVAPVFEEAASERRVFIPAADDWTDFWTNVPIHAGWHICQGPIGFPPVFVRSGTKFHETFASAAQAHLQWGNR